MLDQREFNVQLVVTTAYQYVVTARTPEEAVSIAEGMLEDGEQGALLSRDVDTGDAYPMDAEAELEEED